MACCDLKKFFLSWRGGLLLGGLGVLVSAVLISLWQLEQVTFATIIATISLGVAGLYSVWRQYVAWRQLMATEKSTSVAQANVRVAQEGHITEAIEKLGQEGDDKMTIRLSGIYALERLAQDSEKDHGPIMEVLTAYVREKAPRKNDDYKPQADERPPPDIQAILTVIGRRETTGLARRNDRLDLSKTHLVGAILPDANLREADLPWADLRHANLSRTHLDEADLYTVRLNRANLRETHLNKVNLFMAAMDNANLKKTHLEEAKHLIAQQVLSAWNWREAYLPDHLQYLKDLPDPPAGPA